MSGTVNVVLRLQGPDQTMIEEAAFGAHAAEVATALASAAGPYGDLVMRGGDQPEVSVADDLLPLSRALAAGVVRLRAGGGAVIGSFGEPIEWSLDRVGDRIRTRATRPGVIEVREGGGYGEQVDVRDDDASALIAALEGAADRLLALLEGGQLVDDMAARTLVGSRDLLSGKATLPEAPQRRQPTAG